MATLWFSKDGRRPHTQSGQGVSISLPEAEAILTEQARYCGQEPPSINPDTPSRSIKNVVLEITVADGTSTHFPRAGFYWLVGLEPGVAEARLNVRRRTG